MRDPSWAREGGGRRWEGKGELEAFRRVASEVVVTHLGPFSTLSNDGLHEESRKRKG